MILKNLYKLNKKFKTQRKYHSYVYRRYTKFTCMCTLAQISDMTITHRWVQALKSNFCENYRQGVLNRAKNRF